MAYTPRSVTADGALVTGAGTLYGLLIGATSANAASALVYDNASAASGTIVAGGSCAASSATLIEFEDGVRFANGLYCNLTTDGTCVIVAYIG